MNPDKVFLLSMNRASLVMNRYVNKRLRNSVDSSVNINTFKILNAIKDSNGILTENEYSRLGCDRTTFYRNVQVIINLGFCIKGEIPENERKPKHARVVYKLTDSGEDILMRSIPVMELIDSQMKRLWDRSYAKNVSNRAIYLLDPKKCLEKPPDVSSAENFASIVNRFCGYIKRIRLKAI